MPFHSWEPRNAIARSRPSCSTSTRRFRVELNPRALTLKSFTPLCTMSTPGTLWSAIGAWPVTDHALEHLLRYHRNRRRRLDDPLRPPRGALDHDLAQGDGHRLERRVRRDGAVGLDHHLHLGRRVAEPAEDDRLRASGYPAQRISPVGIRDGADPGPLHGHGDAAQRGAVDRAGHGPGHGADVLGVGDGDWREEQREGEGETDQAPTAEECRRIQSHTGQPFCWGER